MRHKRVLIVANTTWNIYKFRLNVIKQFIDNENEVFVAAPLDEYISFIDDFPKVKHIPLTNLKRDHSHPITDVLTILELRKIYKRLKPDIVIHYTHKANIYGGIAAKLTSVKSIGVVTGLGYAFLRSGWINRLTRLLYKSVKSIHEKLVFENEDDMNLFIDLKLVHKQKAHFVNGCGVDTERYAPIAKVKSLERKTTFTFIGRLLYDKGINEFVEAAKRIKNKYNNIEFCVIGELDEGNPSIVDKTILNGWIDSDTIKYLGFIKDVRPHIAESDCLILPSYREGMPRIILEGLSMATPVITTDVPGCRQTVEHGINGYLVKPKDVSSLVKGIEAFLEMPVEARTIMGQKGREMAIDRFNSEKISLELFEIVSQVYFCA